MDKIKVEICLGTPCYLMGARELIDDMQSLREEYPGQIKLKTLHCIEDRCDKAPIVKVDGQIYEEMNPDKLRKLVLNKI